jgi:hypothetical protein
MTGRRWRWAIGCAGTQLCVRLLGCLISHHLGLAATEASGEGPAELVGLGSEDAVAGRVDRTVPGFGLVGRCGLVLVVVAKVAVGEVEDLVVVAGDGGKFLWVAAVGSLEFALERLDLSLLQLVFKVWSQS